MGSLRGEGKTLDKASALGPSTGASLERCTAPPAPRRGDVARPSAGREGGNGKAAKQTQPYHHPPTLSRARTVASATLSPAVAAAVTPQMHTARFARAARNKEKEMTQFFKTVNVYGADTEGGAQHAAEPSKKEGEKTRCTPWHNRYTHE